MEKIFSCGLDIPRSWVLVRRPWQWKRKTS